MDFLQTVFLESPTWLGVFSFAGFAVMLFARRRMGEAGQKWGLPATLIAIVLLFVLQSLITTQRERIIGRLRGLVTALEAVDTAGINDAISDSFSGRAAGKAQAVDRIARCFQSNRVWDTRLRGIKVDVSGDTAEMGVGAVATVSRDGGTGERHWGRWELTWRHEPDGWRITSIKTILIDAMPADSVHSLTQYQP